MGTGMVGAHAYVAWSESGTADGPWRLDSYSMNSLGEGLLDRAIRASCAA